MKQSVISLQTNGILMQRNLMMLVWMEKTSLKNFLFQVQLKGYHRNNHWNTLGSHDAVSQNDGSWNINTYVWRTMHQTSADSAVRILSEFTMRCLSVKIKFKFEIRTLEHPPDWKFPILTDRHRIVNSDRIRTAVSADVCHAHWHSSGVNQSIYSFHNYVILASYPTLCQCVKW